MEVLASGVCVHRRGVGARGSEIFPSTATEEVQPVELSDFYPSLGNCFVVPVIVWQ